MYFLRLDVQVIPVAVKTPASCSMPGVLWHSFHLKEKGLAGWGSPEPLKSRRHSSPELCWGCVGVQCHQEPVWAVLQSREQVTTPPAGDSLTNSHHCSPRPIQGLSWLIPHPQQLSPRSHSASALRQRRNMRALVTSLEIKNLTNVSMLSMCSRAPSEWFDKIWFSSFSRELPPVQLLLFHSSCKQLLRISSRNAAPQLKCLGMLKPLITS